MSRSLHIVAADDDPAMCYFYEQTLPRLGHQVRIARDGRQLVQMCRAAGPDLVIADVKMPGLDGIEAVQEINREREVPAILVSAYDDLVIADVGHIMGYLVKPVRPADLNAAITLARARFEQYQGVPRQRCWGRRALPRDGLNPGANAGAGPRPGRPGASRHCRACPPAAGPCAVRAAPWQRWGRGCGRPGATRARNDRAPAHQR